MRPSRTTGEWGGVIQPSLVDDATDDLLHLVASCDGWSSVFCVTNNPVSEGVDVCNVNPTCDVRTREFL